MQETSVEQNGSLREYVARFTPLERFGPGGWYRGKCPLCTDEETNLVIFPNKGEEFFHCYECGEEGTALDFKALMEPDRVVSIYSRHTHSEVDENEAAPAEKEGRRNQADRLIGLRSDKEETADISEGLLSGSLYALEDAQALFVDQHGAPHALVDGEPLPLNSRC